MVAFEGKKGGGSFFSSPAEWRFCGKFFWIILNKSYPKTYV